MEELTRILTSLGDHRISTSSAFSWRTNNCTGYYGGPPPLILTHQTVTYCGSWILGHVEWSSYDIRPQTSSSCVFRVRCCLLTNTSAWSVARQQTDSTVLKKKLLLVWGVIRILCVWTCLNNMLRPWETGPNPKRLRLHELGYLIMWKKHEKTLWFGNTRRLRLLCLFFIVIRREYQERRSIRSSSDGCSVSWETSFFTTQ